MADLAERECVPCRGGVPPMKGEEIEKLLQQLEGWQVIDEHHLQKIYRFKDFRESLEFVNRVGNLAEQQGHHPDICFGWGKAEVTIWTHKIDGLSESDFVLAAKIDKLKVLTPLKRATEPSQSRIETGGWRESLRTDSEVMMKTFSYHALILSLLLSAAIFAQQPKPQKPVQPVTPEPGQEKPEVINVRRVHLPITVLDKRGQFVSGLGQNDFLIFEDKVAQQIDSFTSEENNNLPLYVAVLMDTSPSTAGKLKFEQESAMNFIQTVVRPRKDRVLFATFDDRVTLPIDSSYWIAQCLPSRKPVRKRRSMTPSGNSATKRCARRKAGGRWW